MFPSRAAVLGLLVPLTLLAACQQPPPTPAPAPSFRCTPEAGGDEYDCSQAQHDEMVSKDTLYAEAEAVFRKFFAEDVRIARVGGITTRTDAIEKTTMGNFQRDSMLLYRDMKASGRKSVGGEISLVRIERSPGVARAGSAVSMRACTDASSTTTLEHGKPVGRGTVVEDQLFFADEGGVLKVSDTIAKQAASC